MSATMRERVLRMLTGNRGLRPTLRFLAPVVALGLLGVAAPAALGDSASISVTNTAGVSDPAAHVPRVFTVSGVSAAPSRLWVKYRAPGGAECAADAREDSGSILEGNDFAWWSEEVNGDFSVAHVLTWPTPGQTMFCIWIASEEEEISKPFTQVINFRSPGGTVTASISPSMPLPGQQATITVSGSSEAAAELFATVKRAGGGVSCSPDEESDTGEGVLSAQVNGSFSQQAQYTQQTAGTYLLCVWLAASRSAVPAIAGPQPINFNVGYPPAPPPPPPPPPPPSPPPPCVVPTFSTDMSLSAVKHRISASHCRVGRVRYAHSRSVRRGNVVRLSPRPHSHLSHGAYVSVLVSSGR